jgi:hypothetical protein
MPAQLDHLILRVAPSSTKNGGAVTTLTRAGPLDVASPVPGLPADPG